MDYRVICRTVSKIELVPMTNGEVVGIKYFATLLVHHHMISGQLLDYYNLDISSVIRQVYENLIIEIIRMNRTNTKTTIANTIHVVDPLLPR
jgi:hypothetical protein